MPFKPRHVSKGEIDELKQNHVWSTPPSLESVEMVFITADTMDDFIRYGVFAWDVNDNLYMVEDGEVPYLELSAEKREEINQQLKEAKKPPVVTLEDILNKDILIKDGVGIKATFLCIDAMGHKTSEVKHFAKMHSQVIMQKGTSLTSQQWKMSDNHEKMIISNEKHWKSSLIYYLYSQKNKKENYLYFNPDITEASLEEIRDVKPDNKSKWGNEPSNWVSQTGKDHLFDVLKYAYLARDFALNSFKKTRFRFAKAPSILRRFDRAQKREEAIRQFEASRSSWFDKI